MDANSMNDIQHAIFTIREALSGHDRYLDGDLLPPMSLSSKHNVVQRELRSIIQSLDHLDHSHSPQSLDPGSRNLTLHRYVAFRAKAAVVAVDCAFSHLRHDIFWKVIPEMAAAAVVISQDTMNSSEGFLILLHERVESLPDRFLIGLPNMVDFYIVMHKLGFLLRDLSHTRNFVQTNMVNETNGPPADTAASVIHPMPLGDEHPGETGQSIVGEDSNNRDASKICRPRLGALSPASNAGSHDTEVSQLLNEFAPSVSPFTSQPNVNDSPQPGHSLDFNYEFPSKSRSQSRNEEFARPQGSTHPTIVKPNSRSRRHCQRRRRNREGFSANSSDTLPAAADHADSGRPENRFRRNAITFTPPLGSRSSELKNVFPVRPSHRRNRTYTVRQDLPNPLYRHRSVSKVYTLSSSADTELEEDRTYLNECATGLNTASLDHDPKPQSTHTDVETTVKARRRARRRNARKLKRRLRARERKNAIQRELDGKLAEEAKAVSAWRFFAGDRAWEDVSWCGSMDG